MSQWQPLAPTAVHRWMHAHRHPIHVGLALASAFLAGLVAWSALVGSIGWSMAPVVAYAVAQVVILHVWLRRASLRVLAEQRRARASGEGG